MCFSHILFNSYNTVNYTLQCMDVRGSEVEEFAQVEVENGKGMFQAWHLLLKVVCFDKEDQKCYLQAYKETGLELSLSSNRTTYSDLECFKFY